MDQNKDLPKYQITFSHTVSLCDHSKTGSARFNAEVKAGTYNATRVPNPTGEKYTSDWYLLDGTTIGATVEFIQNVANSITTLS